MSGKRRDLKAEVIKYIWNHRGLCNETMIAMDLRVTHATVKRHLKTLENEGKTIRNAWKLIREYDCDGRLCLDLELPMEVNP